MSDIAIDHLIMKLEGISTEVHHALAELYVLRGDKKTVAAPGKKFPTLEELTSGKGEGRGE